MWKLIVGGVAAFLGYEAYKKHKLAVGPAGGFAMVPGHLFVFTYGYPGLGQAGPPATLLSINQAQQALDVNNPGMFDVVSANENTSNKTFTVGAVFTGPAAVAVSPAHLTAGFPAAYGALTVQTAQDTGGAPMIAPAVTAPAS